MVHDPLYTYGQVQSSIGLRWTLMHEMEYHLAALPRDAQLGTVKTFVEFSNELGRGEYSIVYAGKVRHHQAPYTVAVKHMIIDTSKRKEGDGTVDQLLREEMAYSYLNALMQLRISPNFPLLYKTIVRNDQSQCNYMMIMEVSDYDMSEWLKTPRRPNDYMSAILQVTMGCVAMIIHLDMVNNDLYPKNILVNEVARAPIAYMLNGRHYFLHDQGGFLFKLADFGICSSPQYLRNSHNMGKTFFEALAHLGSYETFDYSKHILAYENVPFYARDLLVFYRSLLNIRDVCKSGLPVLWLQRAVQYMDTCARVDLFATAEGLCTYVEKIFSPRFLQNSKLSPRLFGGNTHPPQDAHLYNIQGDDTTHDSIMWMVKEKLEN